MQGDIPVNSLHGRHYQSIWLERKPEDPRIAKEVIMFKTGVGAVCGTRPAEILGEASGKRNACAPIGACGAGPRDYKWERTTFCIASSSKNGSAGSATGPPSRVD